MLNKIRNLGNDKKRIVTIMPSNYLKKCQICAQNLLVNYNFIIIGKLLILFLNYRLIFVKYRPVSQCYRNGFKDFLKVNAKATYIHLSFNVCPHDYVNIGKDKEASVRRCS